MSASLFPRAGVAAEKFERPGVSAAQLATLLPGAKSGRCEEQARDLPRLNQEPTAQPQRFEPLQGADD